MEVKKIVFFITACSSVISSASHAQSKADTLLPSQRIDIYQEYVPEVKMPEKPELTPSDPDLKAGASPSFDYTVPAQTLQYSYSAVPIKPLALQPIPGSVAYQNYAALGLGNYRSILADLGLTYHQDGKYDAYIHGYHFSQKGGKIEDRQSSITEAAIGGKYFLSRYELFGNVKYSRRGFTYYGYDHDDFIYDKDMLTQAYNTIHADVGLAKFALNKNGIAFQPTAEVYATTAKQGGNEFGFGWNAPLSYGISEDLDVSIGFQGMLTTFAHPDLSNKGNAYFQFNPSLTYNKDRLYAHLGVSPATATGNGWGLLPKLKLRYVIGREAKAAISAGWDGEVVLYSFKNLTDKNPFILYPKINNAFHRNIYGGLEVALLSNLKLEGKLAYHSFNKYAIFFNDYFSDVSGKYFGVQYAENINVLETYVGMHILIANKFDLGANLTYYNFSKTDIPILHEPKIDLGSYLKIKPVEELTLGANLNILGGIQYQDISNEKENIPTAFNLGFNAQYEFLNRFALFLNLDNVLDNKYQRWNQYNVYGFNIFGGLKVKF